MISTASWVPVEELPPPKHKTVLLYQKGDLYPIVGSRFGRCSCCGDTHGRRCEGDHPPCPPEAGHYMLEEGGPEDGEHRSYPFLRGNYAPTHWCELPEVPFE